MAPSEARYFDTSMTRAAKLYRTFREAEAARERGDKDILGTAAIGHTLRTEHLRS